MHFACMGLNVLFLLKFRVFSDPPFPVCLWWLLSLRSLCHCELPIFSQVILSASHVPLAQSPRHSVKGCCCSVSRRRCVPFTSRLRPAPLSPLAQRPLSSDRCVASRPVSYSLRDLRLRVPSFPGPENRPAAARRPPASTCSFSISCPVRASPCRPVVQHQPPSGMPRPLLASSLHCIWL